ncbi:hypothetical protein [Bacteroides sp.]
MKTLRLLLVTALWITLCTGFYSCSKDLESVPLDYMGGTDTDKEFANYGITDFKDIEMRSCSGIDDNTGDYRWGQANFAGLRKNHLWIASFDRDSKQKLAEWTDTKEFQKTRRIHIGYGEYKDVTISGIALRQIYSKANSFVAFVQLQGSNYGENLYIFKTPTSIKELKGIDYCSIQEWYKESILIGNCCYTLGGDTIAVFKEGFSGGSPLTSKLISYTEDIIAYRANYSDAIYLTKYNYGSGEKEWNTEISELSKEPKDAKITISILDSSTNIWKYKADIVHYDGTKKDYTFSINIETGTIIGEELPISYANLKGTWNMTKCYGWEYNGDGVKEDWTEDVKGEYIFFESTHGNGGYFDGDDTSYFASSLQGNKLILENSNWLIGKSITITKLTATELHITATEASSVENYEMKKR